MDTNNSLYEYQRFEEDYFSGSDVRLFFGDILVDEIVGLNLMVMERVKPIFGYRSRTADAFARGIRMIQGSFTINFKGPSYIRNILDKINRLDPKERSKPFAGYADNWHKPRSVEEVLEQAKYSYRDVSKKMQRSIWGEEKENSTAQNPMDTFFYKQEHIGLLEDGFNILITYGNVNKENSVYTSNSIIGVQLSGMSKEIRGNDGTPILESYEFMAKDIDGDISLIR